MLPDQIKALRATFPQNLSETHIQEIIAKLPEDLEITVSVLQALCFNAKHLSNASDVQLQLLVQARSKAITLRQLVLHPIDPKLIAFTTEIYSRMLSQQLCNLLDEFFVKYLTKAERKSLAIGIRKIWQANLTATTWNNLEELYTRSLQTVTPEEKSFLTSLRTT